MNILLTSIFLLFQLSVPNYSNSNFHPPLHIPLYLSGNFGELRSNHFHTGIDIKTNGRVGYRVYSIDDGYVSRIKVSASGYGNALYITHDNGFTSVYAHLSKFNIQIENYLRSIQYKRHKFEVDIYPKPHYISVTKDQVIGASGNSGGSMGPHLHFEIRETSSEMPVNPLLFSFPIKDNIPPVFSTLYLYSLSSKNTKYPVFKRGSEYVLKYDTLNVFDSVYFGVKVNDFLNGSRNKCGVYNLKLFVNDSLKYEYCVDKLSFFEQRNVMSHMDFSLSKIGTRIHRCFVDPNNTLSTNKIAVNSGIVHIKPNSVKHIRIVAFDSYKNHSELSFCIRGVKSDNVKIDEYKMNVWHWDKVNSFAKNGVEIYFPEKTFFNDVCFRFKKYKRSTNSGYVYSIGNPDIPVKGYYNVKVTLPNEQLKCQDKLFVADVADKHADCICSNVNVINGVANFKLRQFGEFSIMADTVCPKIDFVNVYQGKNIGNKNRILIKIVDNETGIDKYNCFVDGQWLLFEYDKKRDLLSYTFDEYFPKGINHTIVVRVVDKVGNVSEKSINFSTK